MTGVQTLVPMMLTHVNNGLMSIERFVDMTSHGPNRLFGMARKGRIAVVGYVDGALSAEIDLGAVHAGRIEIFGISNARLTQEEKAEACAGFAREVLPAIAAGSFDPVIDREFTFDEIPAARDCMESSAMVGKIVVRVR